MPTKLNTYSISAITKAVQQVPAEQKNSTETYLLTHTDRTIPNSQTLNTLLTAHFPGASLLMSDPQVREIRRELSEIAWQTMLLQVAADATIDRPAEAKPYLYGLFRPESNPNNQLFNNELRQAIEDQDAQALANLYDAHLQGLEPYTAEDLQDLTDEKLVENFSKLYSLYMAAQDAAQLLTAGNTDDTYSHLSNDSRELLKTLNKDLPLFAALISRFEMICHPNYEFVDTAGLMEHNNVAVKAGNAVRALPQDNQDAWFFQQAQTQADHHFDLQLVRQLEKSQIDLSTAKIYDLQQNEYHLNAPSGNRCGEAARQGKPLVCKDAQGRVIALRPDKDNFVETNPQVLLSNAVHTSLTSQVSQLVELATGSAADPFWLLTGSSQYRDVKNALTTHAQLMQTISDPPKNDELDSLFNSLEQLSGAAKNYLKHKDPSITEDMSFDRYMQERGNSAGMSEREKARLQAAFQARDLARNTHSIVSLSRDMGYKNEQTVSADHVFYQGLLRKHAQLEERLDTYLSDPNNTAAAEQISRIMSDPDFYRNKNRNRPADMNELDTLLWEMQQVTELIDDTELLMGLRPQDRAIDQKEAVRINRSRKFKEQDPAEMSVEQLQEQLSVKIRDAALAQAQAQAKSQPQEQLQPQEQPQPQMQPKEAPASAPAPISAVINPDRPWEMNYNAKGSEFVVDNALLNSPIARSNSSEEVRNHLQNHPEMRKPTKRHLEHRAKGLEVIEELEKNNTSRPPLTGYTVYRNGEQVTGEPVMGDTIMLHGVHERRSQTTWNGCWSVSLASQFEYRGVPVPQEVIRIYRPSEYEDNMDVADYYKDMKQSVSSFAGLAARLMPNASLFQIALSSTEGREVTKARMRQTIFHALTKDNSPVSVCAGGHYLTIVGMGNDCVYVKNPMHLLGGDPETVEMWTFDDLLKKGKGSVELNWFSDVQPSLGGSIEDTVDWCHSGMFYGNGRAYSSFRDEANVPLDPKELVIESKIDWEFPGAAPDGGNLCHRTTVFHPIHLKYNRIPGSQYNADALGKMQNELLDHYNVQELSIPDEVNVVLKEASKLRKGDYKDNPHEGMLNLAGKYMDVLDKMKQLHPGLTDPNAAQPNENVKNLHHALIKQLGQIRRAVMDMQQADYKHLIGSKMMEMTYGNEETRPTRYLNENDYAERRQGYLDLRQGLAGMLYYHVAKSYDLEDRQWIDHLKPQTARNEIQKIETGEAFGSMINKMYDLAKKYDYYTGSRYYNFKAFLDNKLGNPAVDRYGQPVTKFKDYPSLENASREELTQRLEALEQERAQLFRDGKLNPRHYDKMPEQYFSKRRNDQERLTQFAELRVAVRSGNTEGLFARYLQHQNKVIQKNAQLNQQEQPQNEGPMLNQEAPQVKQNPEARKIPIA